MLDTLCNLAILGQNKNSFVLFFIFMAKYLQNNNQHSGNTLNNEFILMKGNISRSIYN